MIGGDRLSQSVTTARQIGVQMLQVETNGTRGCGQKVGPSPVQIGVRMGTKEDAIALYAGGYTYRQIEKMPGMPSSASTRATISQKPLRRRRADLMAVQTPSL